MGVLFWFYLFLLLQVVFEGAVVEDHLFVFEVEGE
jgi:hypothetical protein